MSANAPSDNSPPTSAPVVVSRSRLTKTLPSDRIPFSKQAEIIRAYAAASEKAGGPVTNAEVGKFLVLAESTVSTLNAFLTDFGMLTKADGGKFMPTAPLLEHFRVYQLSPERSWAKLTPLFEKSWMGQELIPKLKFRPLPVEEAITDLALASNAEKKHYPLIEAGFDWFVHVGLVIREGDMLRLNTASVGAVIPSDQSAPPPSATPPPPSADRKEEGLLQSVLHLDPTAQRRFVVWAPPTVTKRELDRVKQWLSFQLTVSDDDTSAS